MRTPAIVTITHTPEGHRFAFPDGNVRIYANPVYLAEAHAVVYQTNLAAQEALTTLAGGKLATLESMLPDESRAVVGALRLDLLAIARALA